jgi:hypothetical protein
VRDAVVLCCGVGDGPACGVWNPLRDGWLSIDDAELVVHDAPGDDDRFHRRCDEDVKSHTSARDGPPGQR